MKILWLCSWYPHSSDPFEGDFIDRQAKALAQLQEIEIIHIVQNTNLLKKETYRTEVNTAINLKQTIVYIPYPKLLFKKLSNLLFNYLYYITLHRQLKNYIQKNGKPDIIHVHVPVKAGAAALWANRKYKIPYLVTEHSTIYHNWGKEHFISASPFFKLTTKKIIKKASALITVSNFLGQKMNDIVLKKNYIIIPNVVDTSLFYYQRNNEKNDLFRYLHVSNLSPMKNPYKMLEAIALYLKTNQDAEFIFIGNKDDRLPVEATRLNIAKSNIKFLGEIPYNDVAAEMRQADALFLFSKSETFSCVTAEALCCGLPVIASNVGALSELINIENGILVEPDNIESLANSFEQLQLNYKQYTREKIAEKASTKYKYETVAKQILSIYKEVLNT